MPIYEYQCDTCGRLEILQRLNEPALTQCPHCFTTTINKRMSAPAFQLKGNGWYVTDFKNPPVTQGDLHQATAKLGEKSQGDQVKRMPAKSDSQGS